jgi:hypothetical protein
VKSKPVLISDESYIPYEFSKDFTHIVLKNATGEISFNDLPDTIKTLPISVAEKKQRKIDFTKEYHKTQLP